MHNRSTIFAPLAGAPGGFSAHLRPLQPQSQWSPFKLHPAVWQAVLAVLLCLGLLLAFHSVVQGAVINGELRRQATAAHAREFSRCNTLSAVGARYSCLVQLNGAGQPGATQRDAIDLFAQRN